jgi:hypothetical protein
MNLRILAILALNSWAFAQTVVTTPAGAVNAIPIAKTPTSSVVGVLVFGGIGDTPAPEWSGKVVLVDRGTNTFAQKVNGAKAVGAVGVIIANTASSPIPKSPTLDPESSTIPAVFVTFADGAALKAQAGAIARVGPLALPEPFGHAGEYLMSDGAKYTFAKLVTPTPPTPPVVNPPNLEDAIAGSTVTFIAVADGVPSPSFTWKKDGALIAGATTATLQFSSVAPGDSGFYIAIAANEAGAAESSTVKLNVVPAP